MKKKFLAILPMVLLFSCGKKTTNNNNETLSNDIIYNISHNVCKSSYLELYKGAADLEASVVDLQLNPSQANLVQCQTAWKAVRYTWETTESWLFGPISANNIDPRIDTWPVDFNAIDSVLNTQNTLNEAYVNNLEDALKGFHPIEYFLWGANGAKTANDFTPRQLEYLVALSHNLTSLCKEVSDTWSNSFANDLATAGSGSASYNSLNSAYIEIVDAMSGICDEVANGKIHEPFIAQNAMLEESPFAQNSLKDFTQNIAGVLTIYTCNFKDNKLGIEDLVRQYNTSLDLEIKTKHAEAMAALGAISLPFGEAIISQPIQVQNAIDKINGLADILENKLKPFLMQYGK